MKTEAGPSWKVRLAFGSAVGILIAVGAFSYRSLDLSAASDRWVRHSHEVLGTLQDTVVALQSIESSSRGFALSGDESFLKSHQASVSSLRDHQAAVRTLTVDNPGQQRRLAALETLATRKIEFAETVSSLRRAHGFDAATDAVRSGQGQRLMDEYQDLVRQVRDEELRLLGQREAASQRRLVQTKAILILGFVLALLITGAAGWSVRRDSSRRARAEAALRHSSTERQETEDRYRVLCSSMDEGYCTIEMLFDQRDKAIDYRFLEINQSFEKQTGIRDALGKRIREIAPLLEEYWFEIYGRVALTGEPARFENFAAQLNRWFDVYAFRVGMPQARTVSVLFSDISVRKAAEKHLAGMESRYRGLLEAAPGAMVVVNEGGEIVLLNRQAEKQFGYHRDELVGQAVTAIIEGFAELLIADALRSAEDAPAPPEGTGVELTGRRKNGTAFPIEVMLSPLQSAEGLLVTAAIRDITATRTKAEALLLRKVEELKRSNDELAQFAYIASHDLQEPLRMVASYTQLLSRRYKGKLDADADEFIAFAVDGANRMQRLIQDLLAYSRIGTKGRDLVVTSSEDALQQALTNLGGAIQGGGALVTHDPLPSVLADEMQLTQLFQNLVGNAIKYQSPGVPRVHISAAQDGEKKWLFSVKDNGLGIEPKYFEKIFGMFQRLHGRDEFAGTGIGLAICKKIVERHGGRISVASQLGQGSTFRFALANGRNS